MRARRGLDARCGGGGGAAAAAAELTIDDGGKGRNLYDVRTQGGGIGGSKKKLSCGQIIYKIHTKKGNL